MIYHYYPLGFKSFESTTAEYYLQYGEVYKDAIEILLKEYASQPPMHDYSLAPILFLLRQYMELQLKGIIMHCENSKQVIAKHDIIYLYETAIDAIKTRFGLARLKQLDEDVEKFVFSLGDFDKKAQAFRYPETKNGKDFFGTSSKIDPWLHTKLISLPDLNEIAHKVIDDFEEMDAYIEIQIENEQENYANMG